MQQKLDAFDTETYRITCKFCGERLPQSERPAHLTECGGLDDIREPRDRRADSRGENQ